MDIKKRGRERDTKRGLRTYLRKGEGGERLALRLVLLVMWRGGRRITGGGGGP